MLITKTAARELIKSEIALSRGLPSEDYLNRAFDLFKNQGDYQLSAGIFLIYSPPKMGRPFEQDQPECFELDFA